MTSYRQTSAEVYRQIEEEGLLSRARFAVYATLYRTKPDATAGELARELMHEMPSEGGRGLHGNVGARLTELRDLGVVREVGVRLCAATERHVISWATTDELPTGTIKEGPVRPPLDVMREGVRQLRATVLFAQAQGHLTLSEQIDVMHWLVAKFVDCEPPTQRAKTQKTRRERKTLDNAEGASYGASQDGQPS